MSNNSITVSPIGLSEAVEGLTGYDEKEIEARFGGQIEYLLDAKPTTGMRAMAFVLIARALDGQDVKDAKGKAFRQVMEMTMKQAANFWPEVQDDEIDSDEPETPAGEGDISAD